MRLLASSHHGPATLALTLLAAAVLGTGVAFAAAGGSDPSFNGGDTRLIDFPVERVALAPDGSIVIASCACDDGSAISLTRLSPSGAPVDAFGDHGTVIDDTVAGLHTGPLALAIDGAGTIFVGARAGAAVVPGQPRWGTGDTGVPGDFTVVRYAADGTQEGVSRIPLPLPIEGYAQLRTLVPQADGGLLVAGFIFNWYAFATPPFAIARLDAGGRVDPGFGDGGIKVDDVGAYPMVGGHQPGAAPGSLVLAGTAGNIEGDAVLRRYLADGSVDDTYGGRFPGTDPYFFAEGGALAPDGGLHAFGASKVRHFTADGAPDTTWGTGGEAESGLRAITAMDVQPDGKALVAGTDGEGHAVVVRLTTAGALDTTFGDGGRVTLARPDGASLMTPSGVVVQGDGKAVLGGLAANVPAEPASQRALEPGQRQGWVARLDGDPATETTGTTTTQTTPPTTTTQVPAPPRPVDAAGRPARPIVKQCISKRAFKIRLRIPRGAKAVRAVVKVDGKPVKVVKGSRLKAAVNLKGLPKGRFTVSISVRLVNGKTLKGTRRYETCAAKKDGTIPVL